MIPGAPSSQAPAVPAPVPVVGHVELPVGLVAGSVPAHCWLVDAQAQPDIGVLSIPVSNVLAMLPSGKVEFSLREIISFATPGVFRDESELEADWGAVVSLPLFEVVQRIPAELLARRKDQKPVDAKVVSMADPFSEEMLRKQAEEARLKAEAEAAAGAATPADTVETSEPDAPEMVAETAVPEVAMEPAAEAADSVEATGVISSTGPVALPLPGDPDAPPTLGMDSLPEAESEPESLPETQGAESGRDESPVIPAASLQIEAEPEPVPDFAALAAAAEAALQGGDVKAPLEEVDQAEAEDQAPIQEEQVAPSPIASRFAEALKEEMVQAAPVPAAESKPEDFKLPPLPPRKPLPPEEENTSEIAGMGKAKSAFTAADLAPKEKTAVPEPSKSSPTLAGQASALGAFASVIEKLPPREPVKQTPPPQPVTPAPVPVPISRSEPVISLERRGVNLNTCTLDQLVGEIGCPAPIAKKILAWRELNGTFSDMHALWKVPGMTVETYRLLTGLPGAETSATNELQQALALPEHGELTVRDVTLRVRQWPFMEACIIGGLEGLPIAFDGLDEAFAKSICAFVPRLLRETNNTLTEVGSSPTTELHIIKEDRSLFIFRAGGLVLVAVNRKKYLPGRDLDLLRMIVQELAKSSDSKLEI